MISHISKVISMSVSPAPDPKSVPAAHVVSQVVNANVRGAAPPTVAVTAQASAVGAGQQGDGTDHALVNAVDHLNTNIQNLNRNLEFSIDEGSGSLVVKVVDTETQEVIRQIPREEVLALAKHIMEYEQGHPVGLLQAKA